MTKNNLEKILFEICNDENETVEWIESTNTKHFFNCGCCNNCLCDCNIACSNCGCHCNRDFIEDDCEYISDNEDKDEVGSKVEIPHNNITDFNINIINDNINEKKVRITLKINVIINKETEIYNIDLDINSDTYLKIANELFKQ